jgi:hypothetical protein
VPLRCCRWTYKFRHSIVTNGSSGQRTSLFESQVATLRMFHCHEATTAQRHRLWYSQAATAAVAMLRGVRHACRRVQAPLERCRAAQPRRRCTAIGRRQNASASGRYSLYLPYRLHVILQQICVLRLVLSCGFMPARKQDADSCRAVP